MDSIRKAFSHKLKEERKKRKFTQIQMAFFLDISTDHLRNLEYGKSLPSFELFVRIVRKMNWSFDDILSPPKEKNELAERIHRRIDLLDEKKLLYAHEIIEGLYNLDVK